MSKTCHKPLTVAKLIEILKKYPPKLHVVMLEPDILDGVTNIVGAKEIEGYVFLFPLGSDPDEAEEENDMAKYMQLLRDEADMDEDGLDY